ncbi:Holliday junction ATP-dependent DNA helicase RuvA [Gracilibacillus halophilus YIM-C55.5]|uniref:Holliday junction branch migration complex subunit RuvA n=1 Tax=Gracilibacillus halophilus YIM-C55.5 TaxID=1308866 RepID=N4WD04_9BACI|nr:Holliday junction branch migration protein RuvA [Gracilibacillus halophilus]ENH97104.1 Holliday junction ATP-dependent DNA helicase RuvA [Gracilibacillus halophilus YIM-C55.5]
MIAYIKGNVEDINDQAVIIETNGIGYEVIYANPYDFQSKIGEIVKIHTFHYIREDAQMLYGFKTPDEKQLFSQILNVSGVGPKGALAILAAASVGDVVVAIEQEDEKFLTSFPGVGKKTARQMILDLKGKLPFTAPDATEVVNEQTQHDTSDNQALLEAIEALKALGYSEKEINQIKPKLVEEQTDQPDVYIKKGLSLMMK